VHERFTQDQGHYPVECMLLSWHMPSLLLAQTTLVELNLAESGCVPLHIPVNRFTERAMYFLFPEQLNLSGNHTCTT